MRDGAGLYFYHNDHLGTPQRMTDATSGAIVWSVGYAAFGKATVDPLSTIENNLRFPGQYFDEETGLHYNWQRTYDPENGRYTQVDPIGLRGGIDPYGYSFNTPINLIDPYGLIPPSMVPQYLIDNAQYAVNNITNNAFNQKELSRLTDLVISTISLNPFATAFLNDALRLGSVDPTSNPLLLSENQAKSVDDVFKSLSKDKLSDEDRHLVERAEEEYRKAIETGKVLIDSPQKKISKSTENRLIDCP